MKSCNFLRIRRELRLCPLSRRCPSRRRWCVRHSVWRQRPAHAFVMSWQLFWWVSTNVYYLHGRAREVHFAELEDENIWKRELDQLHERKVSRKPELTVSVLFDWNVIAEGGGMVAWSIKDMRMMWDLKGTWWRLCYVLFGRGWHQLLPPFLWPGTASRSQRLSRSCLPEGLRQNKELVSNWFGHQSCWFEGPFWYLTP